MDFDVDMAVEATCPAWLASLPDAEERCRAAALAALAAGLRERPLAGVDSGIELAIVLSDDAEVRRFNRDYRGQDKPTNVLSFAALDGDDPLPEPDEPLLLGDVIIAHETTAAEAAAEGLSLADHLSHLVVHGVLHLIGYDHEEDDAALDMERLEAASLAGLGIADPYARVDSGTPMRS
ncbi:MAG: rRNA maturation RNase YbeY [Alphaproteobacteria bacterium]